MLDENSITKLREKALNSLYFFIKGVLQQNYLYAPLHKKVCDTIQNTIEKRTGIANILVVLPRGFLKSTITSFGLPLWLVCKYGGDIRILLLCNTYENACKFGKKMKLTIQLNKLLQALFPEIIPPNFNKIKWSDSSFVLPRSQEYQEGTIETAGLRTSVISRHYNIIITDDYLSPRKDDVSGQEVMPTVEEVEEAKGSYNLLDNLLIRNPDFPDICIDVGTRWCKYDLIEHIRHIKSGNLVDIDIPAVIEREGIEEATYPTRFSLSTLDGIRRNQGTYLYSTLYLNKPYDVSNVVFRKEDLQYYSKVESLGNLYKIISCDPAWSKKKQACNTAIVVLGLTKDRRFIYVLDYVAEKIRPEKLVQETFRLYKKYGDIKKVIVETVGAQEVFLNLFKALLREKSIDEDFYLPLTSYKPKGDKKERIIAVLEPLVTSNRIFIRNNMEELESEFLDFPYGKNIDLLDALVQGISCLGSLTVATNPVKEEFNMRNYKFQITFEDIIESMGNVDKRSFFKYQDYNLKLGGEYK